MLFKVRSDERLMNCPASRNVSPLLCILNKRISYPVVLLCLQKNISQNVGLKNSNVNKSHCL